MCRRRAGGAGGAYGTAYRGRGLRMGDDSGAARAWQEVLEVERIVTEFEMKIRAWKEGGYQGPPPRRQQHAA